MAREGLLFTNGFIEVYTAITVNTTGTSKEN